MLGVSSTKRQKKRPNDFLQNIGMRWLQSLKYCVQSISPNQLGSQLINAMIYKHIEKTNMPSIMSRVKIYQTFIRTCYNHRLILRMLCFYCTISTCISAQAQRQHASLNAWHVCPSLLLLLNTKQQSLAASQLLSSGFQLFTTCDQQKHFHLITEIVLAFPHFNLTF